MLQFAITVLFAFAGGASVLVVAHSLRRAWRAAGELRCALARLDDHDLVVRRTYTLERRVAPAPLRVIRGAKPARRAAAPCALPVAA